MTGGAMGPYFDRARKAEDARQAARDETHHARVVVRWSLRMPGGTTLTREWTMRQVSEGEVPPSALPPWLDEPLKSWPHPRDPVTFEGAVRAGHEQDARDLLGPAAREA